MHCTIAPVLFAAATLAATGGGGHAAAAAPIAQSIDWKAVEQALGRSGAMQPGDVYKFALPRSDLSVTIAGIRLKPAFALGSWVAFKATRSGAIAMGDLVLLEGEVQPVMTALAEGGVAVTALHHHLLHESPRVYYMHIHGSGDAVQLAQAIHIAVALTPTPAPPLSPAPASSPLSIDTTRIVRVLGVAGKLNGTVYQVSVPRPDTIRENEMVIPPALGTATVLNFQPTGGGNAATTGDFVLRAAEVNPVLQALHRHGIEVTAVHNHMLDEEPRLFFMHFWAVGDAAQLATGLRAALDVMSSAAR